MKMDLRFTQKSIAAFNIPPFYTMEMMKFSDAYEAAGNTVYHLEVGQPIAKTPDLVTEEAIRVLQEERLNYCPALGYMPLREAIAQHYEYAYGLTLDPQRVVVTPGTSLGLYVALLMNFKKGSKIAVASPSYPCYRNVIHSLGHAVVEIPTQYEEKYLITPEQFTEYASDIDGLLIASPNNPTGTMYDERALNKIVSLCQHHGVQIISDEIYHGISFEKKAQTVLCNDQNAIIINGFSKYFSMTGWRLGWMVVPKNSVDNYNNLLQNMILCTSVLTQKAAIKAFSAYAELDALVASYQKNRDLLFSGLQSAGLKKIYKADGAFYTYVELDDCNQGSLEFCKKLLQETGVAAAPGIDFVSKAKCSIRLSFCQSENIIEKASERLSQFLREFK